MMQKKKGIRRAGCKPKHHTKLQGAAECRSGEVCCFRATHAHSSSKGPVSRAQTEMLQTDTCQAGWLLALDSPEQIEIETVRRMRYLCSH